MVLEHQHALDTLSSATTLWGAITVPILQMWKSRLTEVASPV